MKQVILLFTTSGCHLCEQAQAMVQYLSDNDSIVNSSVELKLVEIANDEQLVDVYGIRIPVLSNGLKELGWPFELDELKNWLLTSVS